MKIMRVYRFLKKEYGLEAIRDRRLKISDIRKLNDPFEFFAVDMTDPNFREGMNAGKDGIAEESGILCFSRDWSNPVQWAHYADNHEGVCLGFDRPSSLLEKVTYVEDRIDLDGKMDEELVMKLLKTKYIHWSYEKEYRAFIPRKENEKGIYYFEFSDKLILENVIVGEKSKISPGELNNALGSLKPKVEVFKVRPGFEKFEMVKDDSLWS